MDSALADLSSTFSGLTLKPVDKTALSARIAEVKDTQKGDYTDESWSVFQFALSAAQAMNANAGATQAQIDAALASLNNAFSGLTIKPVDKTALNARIAEVKDTLKGDYTEESWNAFQNALTAAQAINANANALQAQVDSALADLSSAFSGLVLKPVDKTALNARIAEVKDTQKGDYTEESWIAFQYDLSAAQAVAANLDAIQAQADSALAALNSSYNGLTVNEVFVAPTITGPTTMTLTAGNTQTSTGGYTLTGVPEPTVTASGSPGIWWSDDTKRLNILPALPPGEYITVLTASNGVGPDATLTFTLTVNPGFYAPSITGPTAMKLLRGYAATSTDEFILTGTMPGLTVTLDNTYGGKISWNAGVRKLNVASGLATGEYTVVLTASNGVQPDATATFKLTVAKTIFSTKYESNFMNWILFFLGFGWFWMWI